MRLVILVLGVAAAACVQAATCMAQSAAGTVALLELYTSDSCAACRGAQQWLARFKRAHAREGFLPVVLRFDIADYLYSGSDRPQRKLTPRQRLALLHTPKALLQGHDLLHLVDREIDEAVRAINATRARARIRLELSVAGENAIRLAARAELLEPADWADSALYLAAYHEREEGYRVLQWEGPFGFPGGQAKLAGRELALPPGTPPAAFGAVGFVQNRRTGEILQALAVPAC